MLKPLEQLPSCIFLDLDNTLYDYESAQQAGLLNASRVAALILNVSDEQFEETFAQARLDVKRQLGETAASHSRLLYFQRMIELMGLATQASAALRIEEGYWSAFLEVASIKPNVYEFLDDVRLAGVPMMIITDLTSSVQYRKFLLWRLDQYIDWMTTSEEAGAEKPNPEIFKYAMSKLDIADGPIWMIGDHPERDLRGAKDALGAVTFQVLHNNEKASEFADFAFHDFKEIREIFRDCRTGI